MASLYTHGAAQPSRAPGSGISRLRGHDGHFDERQHDADISDRRMACLLTGQP